MRINTICVFITILIAASSSPSSAATIHVPADHPTIQSCIDAAVSGQDECVVAPGTYNELVDFLGKAITLRSSHGPDVTTIDGTGLNGSVVTLSTDQSVTASMEGFTITGGMGTRPYVSSVGGGIRVRGDEYGQYPVWFYLKDMIITGNEADFGGGISVSIEANLVASDCEIFGNSARYGGGIFGQPFAKIHVQNTSFRNNSAERDGGAVCGEQTTFDAADSEFTQNIAGINGGAVAVVSDLSSVANEMRADPLGQESVQRHPTYVSVRGCRLDLNMAFGKTSNQNDITGGGAIFSESNTLDIRESTFTRNKGRTGGAVLNWCCVGQISDCSFLDNEALEDGGAIYHCESVYSSLFLRNRAGGQGGGTFMCYVEDSVFQHNSALRGGGMSHGSAQSSRFLGNRASQLGGGLYSDVPWARADNCLFVGNMADSGGGAFFEGSAPFNNCTVAFNLANTTGGGGIGVLPSNSLFWGNDAGLSGDELGNGEESFFLVTATDVRNSGGSKNWDGTVGIDGGGNIDADPSFVRLPDDGGDGWGDDSNTPGTDESAHDDFGDLRLSPGSPCVNAGNPDFVERPYTDLDGHARVLCGQVDMGAYEFGIGDHDCNQTINLTDLSALSTCATNPLGDTESSNFASGKRADGTRNAIPDCSSFDFDADGAIDLRDFAHFLLVLNP